MTDARMDAARAIVRIKTTVRKENPTSTAVHVDSVMSTPRPRAKKRKKPILVDETVDKGRGGLGKWFDEKWVDISRPKDGGGYEECGRSDASEGKYPKCVPQSKANSMTAGEKKSAVRRKRDAESSETREGKKPINVATFAKAENIPTDKELYARVKAEAKKKFDVYPSAYANAWLVQEYKRRGGKYRVGKASFSSRSEAGRYAAEQRWKDHSPASNDVVGSGPTGERTANTRRALQETIDKTRTLIAKAQSDEYLASIVGETGQNEEVRQLATQKLAELETLTSTVETTMGDALNVLDNPQGRDRWRAVESIGQAKRAVDSAEKKLYKEISKVDNTAFLNPNNPFGTKPAQRKAGFVPIPKPTTPTGKLVADVWRVTYLLATNLKTVEGLAKKVNESIGMGDIEKASSPAWQREEGKNPKGGLNAKGRASYKRETGGTLRPPVKSGDNPRRASFLARMGNAKGPERDENGKPTRLLLSLQAWGANSKAEARKKAKAISARNKAKKES